MRLRILDHGHKLKNRLALKIMRAAAGTEVDDVAKTSLYRPLFFGRPWIRFASSILRGKSEWSSMERELFGAFVSNLNTCKYCLHIHSSAASPNSDHVITIGKLKNWREAGYNKNIYATLAILEKLMLFPDSFSSAD
ncbi:MAG TPA: hypothetical protein VGK25_02170, partial [Ignavibacteria bacterium]